MTSRMRILFFISFELMLSAFIIDLWGPVPDAETFIFGLGFWLCITCFFYWVCLVWDINSVTITNEVFA